MHVGSVGTMGIAILVESPVRQDPWPVGRAEGPNPDEPAMFASTKEYVIV